MNPQPPHPRLYPLLVGLIYERSKIGILATVVNASILVFILWEEITHWILALWYIIILLISLIRYILNQRFLGRADQTQDIRRWGQILLVGLAIPGLLWGATGIFLFPVHSVAHQVFIAFVLAGMVAGAVGVFSPIMPVFLVFSIPALVPITIRFILIGDQLHMAMGAMITLFAILTFMTAQRVGTSIRELVVLKETFADLLEERTQKVRAREQSLRESEQRLMIAKQAAALGIYDYHLVSGVLTWDDRMRELWGIGPDYPVSYDLFMSGLHPDDRSSTQADVEKAFDPKGDGKHSAEYRVISRADDTERWVGATGTTFFENGKAVRFVGTVQDITGRKKAEEELRQLNENLEQTVQERTEKLRRLAIELTLVEQRERKNLGRILHDGLQQYLVAAKMQINGLMSNLGDAGLRQSASGIENLLSEAVQVSRSLAAELSPPILRDAGILAGLEWLSRWMSEKHGLQVQLVMNMDAPSLSESVKILLFESIREMLLNVVKHAESKSAKILLFRAQVDHLGITVSDAGKGFETKNASESCYQKGFGLFSIQERMQLIGGKLEIESTPGKGCRVTLTAPLEPP
jgi:PAS domain S-box-containing protein